MGPVATQLESTDKVLLDGAALEDPRSHRAQVPQKPSILLLFLQLPLDCPSPYTYTEHECVRGAVPSSSQVPHIHSTFTTTP